MPQFIPINAGMAPDEAIALAIKQCRSLWLSYPDRPGEELDQPRQLLSDPITEHQVSLLTNIAFSITSIQTVIRSLQPPHLNAIHIPPISGHPTQGYWLDFDNPGPFPNHFAGICPIPADPCINRDKPLLHLLSLDTYDSRLELAGAPHRYLPLLFCWTCEPAAPFLYRITPSRVILLDAPLGARTDDFPWNGYPESCPGRAVALTPVPPDYQELIRQVVHADVILPREQEHVRDAKHQIGGDAFLWQPIDDTLRCPSCAGDMPFLATICDNSAGPGTTGDYTQPFCGNLGVQIVFQFCRACWIVAAYQICD